MMRARRAGEFYTPKMVVRTIVECLKPEEGTVDLRPHVRLRRHAARGGASSGAAGQELEKPFAVRPGEEPAIRN